MGFDDVKMQFNLFLGNLEINIFSESVGMQCLTTKFQYLTSVMMEKNIYQENIKACSLQVCRWQGVGTR